MVCTVGGPKEKLAIPIRGEALLHRAKGQLDSTVQVKFAGKLWEVSFHKCHNESASFDGEEEKEISKDPVKRGLL